FSKCCVAVVYKFLSAVKENIHLFSPHYWNIFKIYNVNKKYKFILMLSSLGIGTQEIDHNKWQNHVQNMKRLKTSSLHILIFLEGFQNALTTYHLVLLFAILCLQSCIKIQEIYLEITLNVCFS
ncbi:hypothetical protein ACJX0J_037791, partial [Zea mays]